jgi:hypothetical protein
MYSPKTDYNNTLMIQKERDEELHDIFEKNLKIGLFPKRHSIMMKLIPTLQCVTGQNHRSNLNILLVGRHKYNGTKYIVLKKGREYHLNSQEEALKVMSNKEELPQVDTSITKVQYNF